MPERMKALFRGATHPNGVPKEWLDDEGEDAPRVPARHLTAAEYDALTPRNKQRVREARAAGGGPLYEVRSDKDTTAGESASGPAPAAAVAKAKE